MTEDKLTQYSEILEELARLLDVTDNEFNIITSSYEAVGKFLAEGTSPLQAYSPSIHPQGSFLLGTVVRPISDDGDLDIDLVCELNNKPGYWTQYHLKQAVGDRLRSSKFYREKLDDEGKRCWTLLYGDNKYHLDVLPSLVCDNYREIVTRYFSEGSGRNPEDLAIHITDNTRDDYMTQTNADRWLISNPFGYAQWFLSSAKRAYSEQRTFACEAKIDPVPKYSKDKFVLQRIVQLLKRHRDKMFDGDDDKPISIIITTLATRAYNNERNLFKALRSIAFTMASKVEDRNGVKWVPNPVNPTENFADRWPNNPKLQTSFYTWIERLQRDVNRLESASGLPAIRDILDEMFGETISNKTYENYGKFLLERRKSGGLKAGLTTATLGLSGSVKVAAHNFYGTEEENG